MRRHLNSRAMADATLYSWDDIEEEALNPLLGRKLITGDDVMIAQVFLKKGAVVPMHSHHNEQVTYILKGVLRFTIGGDNPRTVDVHAGDVLHLPSHVPHEALALEDTLDVDVFTPPRQDWLDGTDKYLRDG